MGLYKQTICVRHDLKMRMGKVAAQVGHSCVMSVLPIESINCPLRILRWIEEGMTKIVVKVESEDELLSIVEKAKKCGIATHLVTDAGHTEFHGVPTKTCAAIGPDLCEKIDQLTGDLKLL